MGLGPPLRQLEGGSFSNGDPMGAEGGGMACAWAGEAAVMDSPYSTESTS